MPPPPPPSSPPPPQPHDNRARRSRPTAPPCRTRAGAPTRTDHHVSSASSCSTRRARAAATGAGGRATASTALRGVPRLVPAGARPRPPLADSINIGFAVGSAPRMAATPAAKVFTILYCVYGNAIVVSALQLLRRAAALRELGRADLAADSRYGMFLLLTPYFLVSLALSMVVAKLFAGYGEAVDMIIFAVRRRARRARARRTIDRAQVTNATSCGIFVGNNDEANYVATACAMVVSIPTCAAWTGEASHLLFSSYEALEDGGAAAAEETRWSRGRARAFHLLGPDGAVQRCAADLGLIFLAWVLVGSLFYKYDTPADPWNDGYAVYYSPKPRPSRDAGREPGETRTHAVGVNIGLNLGSAPRHPTNAPATRAGKG